MKNKLTLLLTFFLALIFTACSQKEENVVVKPNAIEGNECIISGVKAPSWACGAYESDTKYAAVGSAPLSKLGHNFSRNEALMNARNNLIQQIELEIKSNAESYMRSSGIKDAEMVEKVVTQVSSQNSSMVLKESKQISYWQNEKDNTIFILAAVDKASVKEKVDEDVKEYINNEIQIKNSEDALNRLEAN